MRFVYALWDQYVAITYEPKITLLVHHRHGLKETITFEDLPRFEEDYDLLIDETFRWDTSLHFNYAANLSDFEQTLHRKYGVPPFSGDMIDRYEAIKAYMKREQIGLDVLFASYPIANHTFCFTGRMPMPRRYAVEFIEDNGGIVVDTSSQADYLVVGEMDHYTNKYLNRGENTKILDVGDFFELYMNN